jgi:hypothetical protein
MHQAKNFIFRKNLEIKGLYPIMYIYHQKIQIKRMQTYEYNNNNWRLYQ